MDLVEKLKIVKSELEQLNDRLRFLCQGQVSDIVFGIRLGMATQQLKDLLDNYIELVNEFEKEESIFMSIQNNIRTAMHTLFDACEDRQSSYCFCVGIAYNYISTAIFELDDWIVTTELS